MAPDDAGVRRLEQMEAVLRDPPPVHPDAPNGKVWRTRRSCYSFLAHQVAAGSRTLETGAGLSTVLFAAWGCDHLAVVPFVEERDAVLGYCEAHGIATDRLSFDLRASQAALPALAGSDERDLVFIDGCHGYPLPIIDWFYGAGLLRRGGVAVFDDMQLPMVSDFVETFLANDPRWERLASMRKWSAFRRLSEGPLAEGEGEQAFYPRPAAPLRHRVRSRAAIVLPPSLRRQLAGRGRSGGQAVS